MACGLGAVILVLILVRIQPEEQPIDLGDLKSDLQKLQQQEIALQSELKEKSNERAAFDTASQSLAERVAAARAKLQSLAQDTSSKQAQLESLKEKIEKTPIAKKQDVVQDDKVGEENYLLGLKVEGRRIVFLVDMSASMTDEKLIHIIRRKSGPDLGKKQGPKWQRTKRVVRWLSNRIPPQSKAMVIGYNNQTQAIGPTNWFQENDGLAISKIFSDLDAVVPAFATNLQKALDQAKSLSPAPTDYYVVTDGLPTAGTSNYRSLNPFAKCSSLTGKSTIISVACRVKLFRQTVRESGPAFTNKVNVVLLPLEGDPDAAPEYWGWTNATGGLLISPAVNWP